MYSKHSVGLFALRSVHTCTIRTPTSFVHTLFIPTVV